MSKIFFLVGTGLKDVSIYENKDRTKEVLRRRFKVKSGAQAKSIAVFSFLV